MTKRIAYTDAEGYTVVILPAYGDLARDVKQTNEELIQFLIDGLEPGTNHIIIDDTDPDTLAVLENRDERDNWAIEGNSLVIST